MNKTLKWIAISVVNVCAINALADMGAAPACQWYVNVGAGPAFEQDLEFQRGSGNLELDLGARFDIAAGYKLDQNWAAELNLGSIWTSLKDIDDANFYQYPFLLNGIYNFHMNGPV